MFPLQFIQQTVLDQLCAWEHGRHLGTVVSQDRYQPNHTSTHPPKQVQNYNCGEDYRGEVHGAVRDMKGDLT